MEDHLLSNTSPECVETQYSPLVTNRIFNYAIVYVVIGAMVSFFTYKSVCCLGPDCIDCPKFIDNKISNKHVHHWCIHTILLVIHMVVCHVFDISNWFSSFFAGIHLGGIFHGIYTYDDWYEFSIPDLRENVSKKFVDDYLKPLDKFLPKTK